MDTPWFVAIRPFDLTFGARWTSFIGWSGLSQLKEVVSLDNMLCARVIEEFTAEDWKHNVHEDFLLDFFCDLDYLLDRIERSGRVDILAAVRHPQFDLRHAFQDDRFKFLGYEVVDTILVSALTNCGGFSKAFQGWELSDVGLISSYDRAIEISQALGRYYPNEEHCKCHVWALWRMDR